MDLETEYLCSARVTGDNRKIIMAENLIPLDVDANDG